MKEILGDSVVILGYGREGRSTHRYLLEHFPDKKIGIADRQESVVPLEAGAKLHTGAGYLESLGEYDVVVRSPGISLQLPELQAFSDSGGKITSATNIFFSECRGVIIGITGTLGKSTTTTLISQILSQHFKDVRLVGNIGRPVLDYLDGSDEKTIFVIELSSFQLEDIQYSSHIAVLLNIVPEHLDRHRSFEEYARAKSGLVRFQTEKDFVVFNSAHDVVARLVEQSSARHCPFSLTPRPEAACFLEGERIVVRDGGEVREVLKRDQVPLLGEGNLENTLAAVTVGVLMKVPLAKIKTAITSFKSLEHRLEFVGEVRGIRFYNDSLATVPEATIHALKSLGNDVETLLVGGHERGLDFSKLGKFLGRTKVRTLILFPPTGERIRQAVAQGIPVGKQPQKHDVSSMKEAVRLAFEKTSPGKICLLSPASASFGLFRDYQDRGNQFKKFVTSTSTLGLTEG